jgi:diguanylate cyclase (GGDEF)-like protein
VETYGQPAGDKVLREVVSRLRALCRPEDLIARIGPHRFGILLLDADGYHAGHFAEAVRDAIANPKIPLDSDVSVRVTASLGVAALPYDAPAPERLLKVTEDAMEAARNAGGNRCHNWHGQLNVIAPTMHR